MFNETEKFSISLKSTMFAVFCPKFLGKNVKPKVSLGCNMGLRVAFGLFLCYAVIVVVY